MADKNRRVGAALLLPDKELCNVGTLPIKRFLILVEEEVVVFPEHGPNIIWQSENLKGPNKFAKKFAKQYFNQ